MKAPYWFIREECLALHDMMPSHYGGIAGVRDEKMLESTLAKPQQLFHHGKPPMDELATAYAAGFVKNHPFLDGNKRTRFVVGAGFLKRNGCEIQATETEAALHTLALAAGEITESTYAEWLKANSKRG